jgi:hypothetical protein
VETFLASQNGSPSFNCLMKLLSPINPMKLTNKSLTTLILTSSLIFISRMLVIWRLMLFLMDCTHSLSDFRIWLISLMVNHLKEYRGLILIHGLENSILRPIET